jgi:hypothetical protein
MAWRRLEQASLVTTEAGTVEIIVSSTWSADDPDFHYFSLSVDDGVTNEPILLTPASVVVVEFAAGVTWQPFTLEVVEHPAGSGHYTIKTTIPGPIANGQERTVRITIDGTTYGPWVFRFEIP